MTNNKEEELLLMASKSPIRYYVVDAFAESPLKGNPAAVCLLENEREEHWLQAVAREFNLSATCYLMKVNGSRSDIISSNNNTEQRGIGIDDVPKYRLRWFAPATELNICGHGTIASAYVLFQNCLEKGNKIEFHTNSGKLLAERIDRSSIDGINDDSKRDTGMTTKQNQLFIRLMFPSIPLVECGTDEMEMASKVVHDTCKPVQTVKMSYEGELIVEYSCGTLVANLRPSIDEIRKWPGRGVVATGAAPKGSGFDFYSRFFCPNLGMAEDPVCGSVHCGLAPYWSKKLGKSDLKAYMASSRGGALNLHMDEENQQVFIEGKAMPVMEGSLFV